jgi:putative spermidine/putrescine transport system permease protein/spermidine/putrescine transport system permease protein
MATPLETTTAPRNTRGIIERVVHSALGVITGMVFVALYAPIFLVVALSFFRMRRGSIQWDTFSTEWYGKLLSNDKIFDALANSVLVGFFSVVSALTLAMLLALYLNNRTDKWSQFLQFVIFLPFLLPPIITGLALLITFQELGLTRSLVTVIIGHTIFILALVYRIILTRLQALSRSLIEASRDLGATPLQTFRYILLPNLKMAVITAALLAFALSFDETLITLFLIGDTNTLPIRLYAMMRVGFTPEINALVALILLFTTVLTVVVARFVSRNSAFKG